MAAQTEDEGGLSVSQLMEDTADVADWFLLGSSLGLQVSQLNEIERDIPDGVGSTKRRKNQVLDTWVKGRTDDPSWRDVATALTKMGEQNVAEKMRRKYSGSMAVSSLQHADPRVEMMVKKNEQKIKGKFTKLQLLVSCRLQEKQINMKYFVMYVRLLFAPGSCIPYSCEIYEIFQAITDNKLWDYVNYCPIQSIVEEFGESDSVIEISLNEYECSLCGFLASTKVVDFIAHSDFLSDTSASSTESLPARLDECYFKRLVIKLKYKPTELSVQYLIDLWKNFSRFWSLPDLPYLLDNIKPGSVVITWLIPTSAVLVMVRKVIDSETPNFYYEFGIVRVEIEDMCIYEEQEQSVKTAAVWKQKQDITLQQLGDTQQWHSERQGSRRHSALGELKHQEELGKGTQRGEVSREARQQEMLGRGTWRGKASRTDSKEKVQTIKFRSHVFDISRYLTPLETEALGYIHGLPEQQYVGKSSLTVLRLLEDREYFSAQNPEGLVGVLKCINRVDLEMKTKGYAKSMKRKIDKKNTRMAEPEYYSDMEWTTAVKTLRKPIPLPKPLPNLPSEMTPPLQEVNDSQIGTRDVLIPRPQRPRTHDEDSDSGSLSPPLLRQYPICSPASSPSMNHTSPHSESSEVITTRSVPSSPLPSRRPQLPRTLKPKPAVQPTMPPVYVTLQRKTDSDDTTFGTQQPEAEDCTGGPTGDSGFDDTEKWRQHIHFENPPPTLNEKYEAPEQSLYYQSS